MKQDGLTFERLCERKYEEITTGRQSVVSQKQAFHLSQPLLPSNVERLSTMLSLSIFEWEVTQNYDLAI